MNEDAPTAFHAAPQGPHLRHHIHPILSLVTDDAHTSMRRRHSLCDGRPRGGPRACRKPQLNPVLQRCAGHLERAIPEVGRVDRVIEYHVRRTQT